MKLIEWAAFLAGLIAVQADIAYSAPSPYGRGSVSTSLTWAGKSDVPRQHVRRLAYGDDGSADGSDDTASSQRYENLFRRLELLLLSQDATGVQEFEDLDDVGFRKYLVQDPKNVKNLFNTLQKGDKELMDTALSRIPVIQLRMLDYTVYLAEALRNNDYTLVEGLLRHGFGPERGSSTACYLLFLLFHEHECAALSLLWEYLVGGEDEPSCMQSNSLMSSNSFSVDSLRFLHSKGVDLSRWKFSQGKSLLHLAVENNDRESVFFLLSIGFKASETGNGTLAPLQLALAGSDLEIVNMLWEASVRPGPTREQKIMEAIISGSVLELQELQQESPEMFKQVFSHSMDWIALALRTQDVELVRMIVEAVPSKVANLRLRRGQTALHFATQKGCTEIMQLLLGTRIDIDSLDSEGKSPLALAVRRGDLSAIKILLDSGANPNISNADGSKIVMLGAASQELPVLQLLLEYKGNLHDIVSLGDSLLFHVTIPEVAEFLISQGLSVNQEDAVGRCIFCRPNYVGTHREVLKVLIKHRINPRYGDGLIQYSLLGRVLDAHDAELSMLVLEEYGAGEFGKATELLTLGIALQDPEALRFVLQYVEDINCLDKAGSPAWFLAVTSSPVRVVEVLLESGVNVSAHDAYGTTALHLAAVNGKINAADLLVAYGADIDALDNGEESPIMYAIKNASKKCIWNLAIKHQADLEVGKNGNTPRSWLERLNLLSELSTDMSRWRTKSANKR